MRESCGRPFRLAFLLFCCAVGGVGSLTAGGKVGIYGIRMVPYGIDAKEYSRAGWGGGIHVIVPAPNLANIVAGVAGIEFVNLLSGTTYYQDRVTLLRVEQQTSQDYGRLYLGGQLGGHGNGFLRPHAGVNIALVWYAFTIDVVVPNDYNRENEIRQKLRDESKLAFGYDFTLGLDLNFNNAIALDGGVKYVKSFSVPQQLGEGSVTIHPQYFQIYLGIGMSFDMLSNY